MNAAHLLTFTATASIRMPLFLPFGLGSKITLCPRSDWTVSCCPSLPFTALQQMVLTGSSITLGCRRKGICRNDVECTAPPLNSKHLS